MAKGLNNRRSGLFLSIALLAPLALGGCSALNARHAQAVDEEQRLEKVLEYALQLPEGTRGRESLVFDARAKEAQAEQIRKAIEASSQAQLVAKGLEGAGKAARGDWIGAAGTLGGIIVAAGTAYVASRSKITSSVEALEARRDASRERQGIAASGARSVDQDRSGASMASRRALEDEQLERVARRLATSLGGPPTIPTEAGAGRHLSGGVGAPTFPLPTDGVGANCCHSGTCSWTGRPHTTRAMRD